MFRFLSNGSSDARRQFSRRNATTRLARLSGVLALVASFIAPTAAFATCNVKQNLQGQVTAAQMFAQVQLEMLQGHVASLHDDFAIPNPSGNGGSFGDVTGYADAEPPLKFPSGFTALADPHALTLDSRVKVEDYTLWSNGAVQIGQYQNSGQTNTRFTDYVGVIGLDKRFNRDFKAGVSIGMGEDDSNIGDDGSNVRTNLFSASVYESWRFAPSTFLDAVAGYSGGSQSIGRFDSTAGSLVFGNRNVNEFYESVALTHDFKLSAVTLSPYLRGDFYQVSLSGYTEQNGPVPLTYGGASANVEAAVIGVRAAYPLVLSWGELTLTSGLEYRATNNGSYSQSFAYLPAGPNFAGSISSSAPNVNQVSGSIGVRAALSRSISCDVGIEEIAAQNGYQSTAVRAGLRVSFCFGLSMRRRIVNGRRASQPPLRKAPAGICRRDAGSSRLYAGLLDGSAARRQTLCIGSGDRNRRRCQRFADSTVAGVEVVR